jgi:hypothetical protein
VGALGSAVHARADGGAVTLSALKSGGATLGTVSKVELLGSTVEMTFSQNAQGLTVTPGGSVSALSGISDSQLTSKMRVLRITHDKGWFNDDDSGASSPGWQRGETKETADLASSGARQAQQLVSEVSGLSAGQHTITIVHRGPGPVAVDAIVVK